jgi:hypothetical protein
MRTQLFKSCQVIPYELILSESIFPHIRYGIMDIQHIYRTLGITPRQTCFLPCGVTALFVNIYLFQPCGLCGVGEMPGMNSERYPPPRPPPPVPQHQAASASAAPAPVDPEGDI